MVKSPTFKIDHDMLERMRDAAAKLSEKMNTSLRETSPGRAKRLRGGKTYHLSAARPMVVFDPEGPFHDVAVAWMNGFGPCPICGEPEMLEWSGRPPFMGDYLRLDECLGCGTVFNSDDDI